MTALRLLAGAIVKAIDWCLGPPGELSDVEDRWWRSIR